jgi:HSP20 family protein
MTAFRNLYLEELARMQERINGLFEQAMLATDPRERDGGLPGTWTPTVDLVETADAYHVFAELPGVRREDIDFQVEERRLDLTGHRQPFTENPNFLRMERSYGPFRRSFELGAAVDAGAASAQFALGVLCLRLPKSAGDGKQAGKQAGPRQGAAGEERS